MPVESKLTLLRKFANLTKRWLSFQLGDRILFLLFLYLIASIGMAVGYQRNSFPEANELGPTAWLSLLCVFLIRFVNFESFKKLKTWLILVGFLTIGVGLLYFVSKEDYSEHPQVELFYLTRHQAIVNAHVMFLAVLILMKLLYGFGPKMAKTAIAGRFKSLFESRTKLLICISATLIAIQVVLSIVDFLNESFRIAAFLEWADMSNPSWWYITLPCFIVVPVTILSRFAKSWWILVGLLLTYFALYLTPTWIELLTRIRIYEIQEVPHYGQIALLLLMLCMGCLLGFTRSSTGRSVPKASWKPNLITVCICGIVASSVVSANRTFDFETLTGWHNSNRWNVAAMVKRTKQNGITQVSLVKEDGIAWLDIEYEISPNESHIFLNNLELNHGSGVLTIKGIHPLIWTHDLHDYPFDLIFENGIISLEQLELISEDSNFSRSGFRSHPTLRNTRIQDPDTSILPPTSFQGMTKFRKRISLIFESDDKALTSASLACLAKSQYFGLLTLRINHLLSASDWNSLITLKSGFDSNAYPTPEHKAASILLSGYWDNIAKHQEWFDCVPDLDTHSHITIFTRSNSQTELKFSAPQVKAFLTKDFRFHLDPFSESAFPAESAYELAFALPAAPSLPLKRKQVIEEIQKNGIESVEKFHWSFGYANENHEPKDATGLVIPFDDDILAADLCHEFPKLEQLYLGETWCGPVYHLGEDDDLELPELNNEAYRNLGRLTNLKELYISAEVSSLDWLDAFEQLETLAVNLGWDWEDDPIRDFDFPANCDSLKKIIFLFHRPSDALCQKLSKLKNLEEVIFLSISDEKIATQTHSLQLQLPNCVVKVAPWKDRMDMLSEMYREHRANMEHLVREKYLKD